jgi:hypothetical protein
LITAMTGVSISCSTTVGRLRVWENEAGAPPPPLPPIPVPAMASLMSSPEQKPFPAPVRITTRASPLSSALENSSVSSCSIRAEMALRR